MQEKKKRRPATQSQLFSPLNCNHKVEKTGALKPRKGLFQSWGSEEEEEDAECPGFVLPCPFHRTLVPSIENSPNEDEGKDAD